MQNLWKTVSQWPLFVIASILGVFINAIRPLQPLLRNPVTAIALIGLLVGGLAFVGFTLRAMLGLSPV